MNSIEKSISLIFGFLFTIPFILLAYSLQIIIGRQTAVQITGKLLSRTTAFGMGCLVPKVKSAMDYSAFQKKIKKNFAIVSVLYDLRIERETEDIIEFRVNFCPITKILRTFGLPELCKYSCAGDWLLAKRNQNNWIFKRDQTIGTGGMYCNHTYCRNIPVKDVK